MPLVYDKYKDAELTIQEVEERDKIILENRIKTLEEDVAALKIALAKFISETKETPAPKRKRRSKAVIDENKSN